MQLKTSLLTTYTIFVLCLLSSCVPSQPTQTNIPNISKTRENKKSQELNKKIIMESFSTEQTNYQVGPGDLLDIKVLEAEELKTVARVNPQNFITFPLLGKVEVGGLTSIEIEDLIAQLLTEKYMRDPHVTVSVVEYQSQRVAVIGEVDKPSTYEIFGKANLLDSLALAGGLSPDAGRKVYISRKDNNGENKSIIVNLDELLEQGDISLNVPIHRGDVIYVPEAGVFYVDGAVNRPGSFKLNKDMSVSKAVASAGGLSKTAKASEITLVRYTEEQPITIPVDLSRINEGAQEDLKIEDQDVIIVGKSAIKNFFDSFRLGFFFPPFSVGVQ